MKEVVDDDKLCHKGVTRRSSDASSKKSATMTVFLFSTILFICALLVNWGNKNVFDRDCFKKVGSDGNSRKWPPVKKIEYSMNCSEGKMRRTCPAVSEPITFEPSSNEASTTTCPEYFQWIYEDLRPWMVTGITLEMVERAKPSADIRITVVDDKVYVEKYKNVYQTRDVFTVWGILQLLRMFPGKLSDFELMISCDDEPLVKKEHFRGPNASTPQPMFHYCGNDETYDIVFPDWAYWSWPETNIKPWNTMLEEMKKGNNRSKWIDREPYAYWKGNIYMGPVRKALNSCRQTSQQDWNTRIYVIDWAREISTGFQGSDLASQCTHRYKIYAEGLTWSVSEKYILACDSVTLLIKPRYYDFFTRSLQPLVHYWPIRIQDMCKAIKFATDWCNTHTDKAESIGKAGSRFVHEKVKMKYVYDYMFHVLSMYAKLFKYKPTVPPGAVEMCPETMACNVGGLEMKYKIEGMVKTPSDVPPCTMPPPFHSTQLKNMLEKNENVIKQLDEWEAAGRLSEQMLESILN